MTARRNGTETGTLKTRMDILIRRSGCSMAWVAFGREVSGDAGEKGLFRRADRVGGSNMHPDAVEPQAEQPLLLVGAVEHFRQRKVALWGVGEQRRRHDRSAGIDE